MRFSFFTLFSFLLITGSYAQQNTNMELVANVNEYAAIGYNDVWGFTDRNGIEYAIIGTRQSTVIYSLEDPANPEEVSVINGVNSLWRDIKSYQDYIYVVADQGADGLIIVDMTNAPDNIEIIRAMDLEVQANGDTSVIERCHNLYIDDNGFCFLSGCNVNQGGVVIYDLNNPRQPQLVGLSDARYSHDNFSRGDTLWSSDITSGFFSVIDVSDKANPRTLATQQTSSNFTHNAWLSDDGKYLFTTDERANAFVDAYDVSDLSNITFLDGFKPLDTEGSGVIPHNTHYYKGFLVTSWYADGVIITDATRPSNLIQVGNYDTFEGTGGGFSGCWGAFPFLPSGLILASDQQTGLYVFQPNYTRACFLEGEVTDIRTGAGLDEVKVDILSNDTNRSATDFTGSYKTGQVTAGTFNVRFTKAGYRSEVVPATLENGRVTILNVELVPLVEVQFSGRTINALDGMPIENAVVQLENEVVTLMGQSDSLGNFSFSAFIDDYQVLGAAWGYLHESLGSVFVEEGMELVVELMPGYQDDFFADLGWLSTTDSASTGFWVRDVPIQTTSSGIAVNPGVDVTTDLGAACYVTGNGGGEIGDDDVDNGKVTLISPPLNLTSYENPSLSFSYWFYNDGGNGTFVPNDTLAVLISNGIDTLGIDSFTVSESNWRQSPTYRLKDYLPTDSLEVFVLFETSDLEGSGHLVEAGIDAFLVIDAEVIQEDSTTTSTNDEMAFVINRAFPNPFIDEISLEFYDGFEVDVLVYNGLGQLVEQYNGIKESLQIGATWTPGVYFVQAKRMNGRGTQSLRIMKQR